MNSILLKAGKKNLYSDTIPGYSPEQLPRQKVHYRKEISLKYTVQTVSSWLSDIIRSVP